MGVTFMLVDLYKTYKTLGLKAAFRQVYRIGPSVVNIAIVCIVRTLRVLKHAFQYTK